MIRIEHAKTIMNTPALDLVVAAWHELLQAKEISRAGVAIGWDHQAVLAYDGALVVGVLSWVDQAWTNEIATGLAYVRPNYRRRGIHTQMFRALVEKAQELQRPMITATVHEGNTASRAAMRSQGRLEAGIISRYSVNLED